MEIPNLQQEVNRKAFDTFAWLTNAVMNGSITKEQFSTGIDALFMAMSGIVSDRDFIAYITEAQNLCEIRNTAVVLEEPKPLEVW